MKRLGLMLSLAGVLLLATGCAATPTELPTPTPEVFNPLPDEDRAFEAARQALAERLAVDPLSIQRVEVTTANWPDGCLGLPQKGEMCTEVIVPGFRVVLEVGGQRYVYRTNQSATVVRAEP